MRGMRGFTLMEMLVALVMAAAVVSPLFVITRGVSETSRSKQMDVEAMQRARTTLDLLVRDFSRAGLFTSPNTALDGRYYNRDNNNSSVQYRSAVSHFNRNADGADVVMLTGNFLGSRTYTAYATAANQLRLVSAVGDADECTHQFNPAYAVAQITDNSGRILEAAVTDAVINGTNICTLTIDAADYHLDSFKSGDTVSVAANQSALYLLEGTDLVRYFVKYDSPDSENGGDCDLDATVSTYADVNVDGVVVPTSRQVLGTYVVDFQVWFRAVTYSAGTQWTLPHYHPLADILDEDDGNFADGLKLPASFHLVPLAADGTVKDEEVSCESFSPGVSLIGPERVRSAMIQVTVRTEKSDGSVRWGLEDTDSPGRMERQSIAPDDSIALPDGQPKFVYQLKTLTTEVEMPNLAARGDLLE